MAKIVSKRKTVVLIYSAREFSKMCRKLSQETPNLSQRELAKILGVSHGVLYCCNKGIYPHK